MGEWNTLGLNGHLFSEIPKWRAQRRSHGEVGRRIYTLPFHLHVAFHGWQRSLFSFLILLPHLPGMSLCPCPFYYPANWNNGFLIKRMIIIANAAGSLSMCLACLWMLCLYHGCISSSLPPGGGDYHHPHFIGEENWGTKRLSYGSCWHSQQAAGVHQLIPPNAKCEYIVLVRSERHAYLYVSDKKC